MIRYYRLFDLLNRRGMKKTDLLKVISAPTIAKLSKGEIIKTDTIDKICLFLECQPSDIMEVITDESEVQDDGFKLIFKPVDQDPKEDIEHIFDNSVAVRSVLEDPEKAKAFIEMIMKQYAESTKK